jgi:hypothetical protein
MPTFLVVLELLGKTDPDGPAAKANLSANFRILH